MTNAQRHTLEEAILAYGTAKALLAEPISEDMREMARNHVTRTWNFVEQTLNWIQEESEVHEGV